MIAITIDCEQWNSGTIRGKKDKDNNNTKYSSEGNENLLKILKKYNIPATFFVTGYYAEREKEQVKRISKEHEIGCHSYGHFYRNNKINLKEDITKSKTILEKIINKKIQGFRAPQMQFSKKLLEVLKDLKFDYDSSLHSAYLPGFYNNKKMPLKPFEEQGIVEIPASASLKFRLPISWIFMRNLPLFYSVYIVKKLLKGGIIPVLYFHSWEFTKIKNTSVPFYITHNTGTKFCEKFEKFLGAFKNEKFVMLNEIIK